MGEGIIEIVRLRAVQKAHRIAGRLARKHALGGSRHHGSTPPKNRKNFVHVDMSKTVRREMIKHFSQRSPVFEPNRWKQCEPVKVTIDRFLFPEIVDWLREDGWLAVYVRGQVQKSGFISKIVTSKRKAIVEFHPWLLHLLKVSEKLDAQYISYCIPRDVDDPKDWVFLPAAAREFFPERLARLRVNTYHL
ncbi:hypothetical protein [Leisingera aquaemixtae]|uniref:hypothetical protein n=1 Tax=Leisingera aquaemixtae TaxID=1396826 RepID=UPI0021A86A24|nr:hypothetical protein [Leisingera aquaemixtae]